MTEARKRLLLLVCRIVGDHVTLPNDDSQELYEAMMNVIEPKEPTPDVPGEGDSDEWIKFIKYHGHNFLDTTRRKQWDAWLARAAQAKTDTAELRAKLKAADDTIELAYHTLQGQTHDGWVAFCESRNVYKKAGGK